MFSVVISLYREEWAQIQNFSTNVELNKETKPVGGGLLAITRRQ